MSVRASGLLGWISLLSSVMGRRRAGALRAAAAYGVESLEGRVMLAGFTPAQIRDAYGVNSILFGATKGDGSGQTIAIVLPYDDPNALSDVNTFSSNFHDATYANLPQMYAPSLGSPTLTVLNQSGQDHAHASSWPVNGNTIGGTAATYDLWDFEASIDVQWAHSIAPQANIDLVEAQTASTADEFTAEATAAGLSGVSVVSNSWDNAETSGETGSDSTFTTAGVTFLAAAGDAGAGTSANTAGYLYPSSSPNVISVGGTDLTVSGTSNSNYAWGGESAWSFTVSNGQGGGGGISQYESSQPSYQAGNVNGASSSHRVTPDVSAVASALSQVQIYDSDTNHYTPGYFDVGGTSVATPIWGGLIAIADQGRVALGSGTLDGYSQTLPALYGLSPSAFHDVVSGNNLYQAITGFDMASGRGSPVANVLVPLLAAYGTTNQLAYWGGDQLTFASPPSTTITAGTSALPTLTVDVKDASGSIVTADSSPVTLSVYGGLDSGVNLNGGTVTVNAVNGVATFNDLWLTAPPNHTGTYSLVATDGGDLATTFTFGVAVASAHATISISALPSFTGTNHGAIPYSSVVADSAGNLFGTTSAGGDTDGDGTAFEMVNGVVGYTYQSLAAFNGSNGSNPFGGVVMDSVGDLFGTTSSGGVSGYGTVYEIASGSGTITTLASFNGSNGQYPYAGVVLDASGDVFGTTTQGTGSSFYGTVFEITGSSIAAHTPVLTTLAPFNGGTTGAYAYGGVTLDSSGNLYGTTSTAGAGLEGTVYELAHGSGTVTTLASFNGSNGQSPHDAVVLDANGNLYGASYYGGANTAGTIFEYAKATGTLTALASFDGSTAGFPFGGVVLDGNGNIFGTSQSFGANGDGTVFELPAGSTTIANLASFASGVNDTNEPQFYGTLALDAHGDVYGTTQYGGTGNAGTVYKLPLLALPAWAKPGSAGSWDGSTLSIPSPVSPVTFSKAIIIANPATFGVTPNVTVNGGALLEIEVPPAGGSFGSPATITFGALTIDSGATATFGQTPSPDFLKLNLSGLTINGSGGSQGTFDIGDNKVYVSYTSGSHSSQVASILSYLATGYNSGAWTGTGITSSAAAADSAEQTAIGWADSADGLIAGQPANTIELMYTLYGDTELVGTVGFNDFTRLTQHYNQTTGGTWDTGDFDYDGSVNFADFTLMTRTYNTNLNPLPPAAQLYDFSYGAQTTFSAGYSPESVVTADVNGDGKPDLIFVNHYSSCVSVMLGNGDGTFAAPHTFATGSSPTSVITADVNGDGAIDLIVASAGSHDAEVLLGNGNGTFQARRTFGVGYGPGAMAAADLNGDGYVDLIVPNFFSGTVSVLLGNGDGTFQAQQTLAASSYPTSVAVADLNGDGKLDIVATGNSSSGRATILLGNGNGTFQSGVTVAAGAYPQSVCIADVNGDGKPDLVVTDAHYGGCIGVLLGNGNGTFQSEYTFAAGTLPEQVRVADLNGDGVLDLVVTNAWYSNQNVGILLGNGNGTFQSEQTLATGSGPLYLAVSDVNGDAKPDIIVGNFSSGTISVFLNTSSY